MSIAARTQGFVFYLSTPEQMTAVPVRQQVLNQIDFIGEEKGLLRIKDESNSEYKQRIQDLEVHKGGYSYDGIINNLSRAFGYQRLKCLTISLVLNGSDIPLATSPRIDVLSDRVVLYSDWRPNGTSVIDREIKTYNPTDSGYFISDLVDLINESTYFSAALESDVRPNMFSSNLIRQNSSRYIRNDTVSNNKRIQLSSGLITKDSLVFDEKLIFKTEVLTAPSSNGEYLVNYLNGTIESYSVPSGTREVSYHYAEFPFVLDYSLIKLYTLQDDNFLNSLFNKEELPSGELQNTLLNSNGAEIFDKLYNDISVFWGK